MFAKAIAFLLVCFTVYTAWVYTCCDGHSKAPEAAALRGWHLWQEKNCQACHQVYGLGGYMGPDLTNVAATRTDDYLRAFIKHGNGRMPDFNMNDSEVHALVSFLAWVNTTGRSRVSADEVHWSGSYRLKHPG